MASLTNVVIEKVFKGKTDTAQGKNGAFEYTKYDVYFEGNKEKFTYFQSGRKPIPEKNMKVVYLDYKEEEKEYKGQIYINRTIGEFKPDQATPISKVVNQSAKDADAKAYINHGEVVVRLMEMCGVGNINLLPTLLKQFNIGIDILMSGEVPKVADNLPKASMPIAVDPNTDEMVYDQEIDLDSIPF